MADIATKNDRVNTSKEMGKPDISIVVCSQQRAEALREALQTLYDLQTDDLFTYEVVVIDNASTDATPAVIEAAATESRRSIRGFYEGRKGISVARNRGVQEALGQWIAFFDDDQAAHPCWLLELWRLAHAKQVRQVAGAVALRLPAGCNRRLDPMCGMLLGESPHTENARPFRGKFNPGAGNWLIERSVFREVGLFDESIGARNEDTNLYRRAAAKGIDGWYTPTAVIDHIIPPSRLEPPYLMKLARGMGIEVVQYEFADRSRLRFFARWLAKAGRMTVLYAPCWAGARLLRWTEQELGYRCRLSLSWAHFREGLRLLFERRQACDISASAATTVRSANA